jgi:nitrate reductase NapE component
MTYSRSNRRSDAKLEAGVKLGLFAIVALALLVGGFSHFGDALKAIAFPIVSAAVGGFAFLVILKSSLMRSKKLGLALVLCAIATTLLWAVLRAPRKWVEDRATVTAIKADTATLRLGATVFAPTGDVTAPQVAHWRVGATVPIWIDPISQTQLSLGPRTTEGGQHYWVLWVVGALVLGASWPLANGSRWIDPNAQSRTAIALPVRGVPVPPAPPSTIERLRLIDWFQFEALCARILEAEGWTVERRGGANADGGADHLAFKNGRKMVVQCKHWTNWKVKPATIRELNGTRFGTNFKADEAVLFTLSGCTVEALKTAKAEGIGIRGALEIAAAIDALGIERFHELTNPDSKLCPKCGAPMILRSTATPFWGCSTFPRCRGKIECARSGT